MWGFGVGGGVGLSSFEMQWDGVVVGGGVLGVLWYSEVGLL